MQVFRLRLYKTLSLALIALLALSAVAAVAAQDATVEPPVSTPEAEAAEEETSTARPFLGVTFEPIVEIGAEITAISPNSPAEIAGLQVGDVVTSINGEFMSRGDLAALILNYSPGDTITLRVERDRALLEIEVTLGEASQMRAFPPRRGPDGPRGERGRDRMPFRMQPMMSQPFLGVSLEAADGGASVVQVVPDSPAAEAGIEEGDVIATVNGEAINTPEQVVELIASMEIGAEIVLGLSRDGESLELTATLGERENVMQFRFGELPGQGGRGMMQIDPTPFTYLEEENAWEVGEITENSVFYEAGLRPGDRITAIDGEIFDADSLRGALMLTGDDVTLTVERDGETLEVTVPDSVLASLFFSAMGMGRGMFEIRPPIDPDRMMPDMRRPMNRARLGVAFITLNEQEAGQLGLDVTEGAVLTQIAASSPAEAAGLQVNDVITAVDGEALTQDFQLSDAISQYSPGDTVTLDVLREGESLQIEVMLGQPEQFSQMRQMRPGQFRVLPPPINPAPMITPDPSAASL